MKRLVALALVAFSVSGCHLFTKQNGRTALDVVNYGCIIANAFLADERVAETCRIQSELQPAMRELLKQHRTAVARDRMRGCSVKEGE